MTTFGSQQPPEVTDHHSFQLKQLRFKLKNAREVKEHTAQRLQEAWDADNEAAKRIIAIEVQLIALGGQEALK